MYNIENFNLHVEEIKSFKADENVTLKCMTLDSLKWKSPHDI